MLNLKIQISRSHIIFMESTQNPKTCADRIGRYEIHLLEGSDLGFTESGEEKSVQTESEALLLGRLDADVQGTGHKRLQSGQTD
jgi:hypothetical protein